MSILPRSRQEAYAREAGIRSQQREVAEAAERLQSKAASVDAEASETRRLQSELAVRERQLAAAEAQQAALEASLKVNVSVSQ
jgi:hypothetical protein